LRGITCKYTKGYHTKIIKRLRDYWSRPEVPIQGKSFILKDHYVTAMRRRDIFNLIFNKTPAQDGGDICPDPVIETPDYVFTERHKLYSRQWHAPFPEGDILQEWSLRHSFSITLEAKGVPAIFQLGKVKLGIAHGALFMGALTDLRMVNIGRHETALHIVLTVSPQPDGASYAKLTVLDGYGLTLSTLKSTQHVITDWTGPINLMTAFHSLSVQGILSITPEPKPITTV
jgi:hypothetical protein